MTLTDGREIVEVNFVIVCACFCARTPQILILNNPYDAFRAAFSPFNYVTCSELSFLPSTVWRVPSCLPSTITSLDRLKLEFKPFTVFLFCVVETNVVLLRLFEAAH